MNRFYLREFQLYDGENTIIFNIVALYEGRDKITVAVTKNGKITVTDYDLLSDENGLYFEYGVVMLWDGHEFDKDVKSSKVDRGYTRYSDEIYFGDIEKVNYEL